MARTIVDTQIEVVTPLGIPLIFRDGRWFLGEIDITPMVAESDVDLFPWPEHGGWSDPIPAARPRVTFRLNVTRINLTTPTEGD